MNVRAEIEKAEAAGLVKVIIDDGVEHVALTPEGWAIVMRDVPPDERRPWPGYHPRAD